MWFGGFGSRWFWRVPSPPCCWKASRLRPCTTCPSFQCMQTTLAWHCGELSQHVRPLRFVCSSTLSVPLNPDMKGFKRGCTRNIHQAVYTFVCSSLLSRSSALGHACQPRGDPFLLQHAAGELERSARRVALHDPVLGAQPRRARRCQGGESADSCHVRLS